MFNFTVVGNLTKDAASKQFGERFAITLNIAINKRLKDRDDMVSYLPMTYWVGSDKIVQYLTKGKKIAVSGDWYETREHEGKYYSQFVVRDLEFVGSSGGNSGNQNAESNSGSDGDDGDIPF